MKSSIEFLTGACGESLREIYDCFKETRQKRINIQKREFSAENYKRIDQLLFVEKQTIDHIADALFDDVDVFESLDEDIYGELIDLKEELIQIINKTQ